MKHVRMRRLPKIVAGVVALWVVLGPPASFAALVEGAITIRPGKGGIDLDSGIASFSVRRWDLKLAPTSDGISPDTESIILGFGVLDRFLIPAGKITASKNRKRFVYKDKSAAVTGGVRLLLITKNRDGTYRVRFKVAQVTLSQLILQDAPVSKCIGFDLTIGNDQALSGVSFERPNAAPSTLIRIVGFCTGVEDWPWA